MNDLKYGPAIKDDVFQIIDALRSTIDTYPFPESIYDIRTLARCLFGSCVELIRAQYACIETRNGFGAHVLQRSLIELAVDFRLIVVLKETKWIRRFVNYNKLFLYWRAGDFESYKSEIPRCLQEYNDYIKLEFVDEFPGSPEQRNKAIKDKYAKSWSGLNFVDRVKTIRQLDKDSDEYLLERAGFWYATSSQYMHPTPYSAIPHFSPKTQAYKFEYDCHDDTLMSAENFAYLMLDMLVGSMARVLPDDGGTKLISLFKSEVMKRPSIFKQASKSG